MLRKLLTTPTEQLGRAGRFVVFQIKLWSHCAKLLKKNRAGQQAAALAYHTLFGIVPLAIVTLLVFQSFPASSQIGDRVKDFVYDQLHLSNIEYTAADTANNEKTIVLTEYLDEIVERFFTGVNKGTITVLSSLIVIWAALGLLSTIERAFNNIWHVTQGRRFVQRTINYWALLTLGPLLLAVGIYVTTHYAAIGRIQQTLLPNIAPRILSYLIALIAFFLLYFVLPNTKVQARSAIWGAAVAALVWTMVKGLFGFYVTELKPYSTVYGVMGMIPVVVLWIYLTWLIVLFGLQLTFTTQHLKTLDAAEISRVRKTEEYFIADELTIINIAREIAAGFEANTAPVEAEVISSKLNIAPELTEKIINNLVASHILAKTTEPKTGFVLVRDPANIKLSDIAQAVGVTDFGRYSAQLEQIAQSRRELLGQHNLKQLLTPREHS
jgi:membrane protein